LEGAPSNPIAARPAYAQAIGCRRPLCPIVNRPSAAIQRPWLALTLIGGPACRSRTSNDYPGFPWPFPEVADGPPPSPKARPALRGRRANRTGPAPRWSPASGGRRADDPAQAPATPLSVDFRPRSGGFGPPQDRGPVPRIRRPCWSARPWREGKGACLKNRTSTPCKKLRLADAWRSANPLEAIDALAPLLGRLD